jgi:obg-like ATPase 1
MAPKKKEEEKKIPLGRPGNNLKSGIVSIPNRIWDSLLRKPTY